ncbi:MAG: hypothetical protein ACK4MG_07945 [Aquabacterium sp.]|uniref:hypothetical protein n=1 Tax=Aquabacterium sp. TaxID=1872578 RepID=UPI002600E140|nr:hypothetical protein [uncultured Aquabacterium sp.]
MGTTWQQLNPSMVDETVDLEGCSYLVTARRRRGTGMWAVSVEAVAIEGDPPKVAWDGEVTVGAGYVSPLVALEAAKSWLVAHQ